jgi:hypothetical protein
VRPLGHTPAQTAHRGGRRRGVGLQVTVGAWGSTPRTLGWPLRFSQRRSLPPSGALEVSRRSPHVTTGHGEHLRRHRARAGAVGRARHEPELELSTCEPRCRAGAVHAGATVPSWSCRTRAPPGPSWSCSTRAPRYRAGAVRHAHYRARVGAVRRGRHRLKLSEFAGRLPRGTGPALTRTAPLR